MAIDSYYKSILDKFQQGPTVYIPYILVSLIITLALYCAFPLLFARLRRKTITETKYAVLCFCGNFLVNLMTFIIFGMFSIGGYILWTVVFVAVGICILRKRGILLVHEYGDFFTAKDILTTSYWRKSVSCFFDIRMLVFAGLIVALRVVVKFFKIPLAADLSLSFDCYVNAVGAVVYGPLTALAVGALSDTLGAILAPSGPYFFPFILVEMSSGFIFALFLWRRKITLSRVIWSKFTVNFFCNILLNSLLMKWYYLWLYGGEKVYNLINLVRIVKNLVLFPLEAGLIALLFQALLPAMASMGLLPRKCAQPVYERKRVLIEIAVSLLISVGIVLLYAFVLKDYFAAHNIKLL